MKDPFNQPQIGKSLTLLCVSYLHDELTLDLYGTHDEDGYEVTDLALSGSTVSLAELVPVAMLESMSKRLDWLLPDGAQLRKESRDESRADMRLWDGAMHI